MIRGRVQGVGFRFYVQETAQALNLSGWVRNLSDGAVEAYGEGNKENLDAWIQKLQQGPPMSRVENLTPAWQSPQGHPAMFSIR